jgi:hypothetical protein
MVRQAHHDVWTFIHHWQRTERIPNSEGPLPDSASFPTDLTLSRVILPLILLALVPGNVLRAQGGYAGSFLRRAILSQEIARGGVFTQFNADASAIFSNSAALARLDHPSVSFSGSTLPWSGQQSATFGFGMGVGEQTGIGIGLYSFGIEEFTGRDVEGRPTGEKSQRELAVSLGGALAIGPGSIGATIRYLRQDNFGLEGSSIGYAIDMSANLAFRNQIFLALGLNNIAGEMSATYDADLRERIPWHARFSATYVYPLDMPSTTLRPDPTGRILEQRLDPRAWVLAAAEARISQIDSTVIVGATVEALPYAAIPAGARVGYNSAGDISGGIFYSFPVEFADRLRLDYTARIDYELGTISHHATFTIAF